MLSQQEGDKDMRIESGNSNTVIQNCLVQVNKSDKIHRPVLSISQEQQVCT